ncbi:MAG: RsmB/NOP family class I SAM-dependent RNA methyltransferase [Bdellovibrionota bacterium]
MNQPVPDFLRDLYRQCLHEPALAKGLIQKHIVKNRSLGSKRRRLYQQWIIDGLRWKNVYQKTLATDTSLTTYNAILDEHIAGLQSKTYQNIEDLADDFSFSFDLVTSLSKKYSFSDTSKILLSMHTPAEVFLRMNTYLQTPPQIQKSLQQDGIDIEKVSDLPFALKVLRKAQLTKCHAYKKGWVDIQDYGSQMIVDHMQLGPKLNIVDGCCRTGGKSLAMQNYTQGQSTIHAVDIDTRVFTELQKRSKRMQATHIHTYDIPAEDPNPLPQLAGKADRVLVDAPCSSFGTLKRRPWLKYQYNADDIKKFAVIQLEVLQRQCQWVKPGGLLIYAVCSILPEETTEVVTQFLQMQTGFSSHIEKYILPYQSSGDGFYLHVLKR